MILKSFSLTLRAVFVLFTLIGFKQGFAQTYTTIAAGNWTNGSIWSGGSAPQAADWNLPATTIIINHNVNYSGSYIEIGRGEYETITIQNGATLSLGSNFSFNSDDLTEVILDNGHLSTSGNFSIKNGGVTMTMRNGSSFDVQGNFTMSNTTVTMEDDTYGYVNNNLELNENTYLNIHEGAELEVNGEIQNNWNSTRIVNNGRLATNTNFINNGTLENGGVLDVGGDFTNHFDFTADFGGTTNIEGDLTSNGDMTIPEGSVLTVGEQFYVHDDAVATINGGLHAASILNDGTITGNGYVKAPDGATVNNGTMFDDSEGAPDCSSGCGNVALPVTLLTFEIREGMNGTDLYWQTASELNNDYFSLEKSSNGIDFFTIAKVDGAGDSKVLRSYSFSDLTSTSSDLVYYRLSQTDYDGTHEMLKVVSVGSGNNLSNIQLVPNVMFGNSLVRVEGAKADMSWKVISLSGQLIRCGSFIGGNEVQFNNLDKGTYLFQVTTPDSRSVQRFVVK